MKIHIPFCFFVRQKHATTALLLAIAANNALFAQANGQPSGNFSVEVKSVDSVVLPCTMSWTVQGG